MPTVLDATVVNSAYDTSGNGGRKLLRLSNGWYVSVVKTTDYFYFYKSTDGNTWSQLCHISTTSIDNNDVSIVSKGTMVYVLSGASTSQIQSHYFDASTVSNVNIYGGSSYVAVDTGQTALGNVSLTINEAGTELHAAWASKNSTYSSSFNIRYAKGTINADGIVTWGAVEQVTKMNSTTYPNAYINPSVTLDKAGNACISVESVGIYWNGTAFDSTSTGRSVLLIKKTGLTAPPASYSDWTFSQISGNNSSYAQSSPSAIFVPQSVNGLANGRIWVAWHGTDATDASYPNIRTSYSDDGGVTWSTMEKRTSGNTLSQMFPSLTANKSNEVHLTWSGWVSSSPSIIIEVRKMKFSSGAWGSASTVTSGGNNSHRYPSTLFDLSVNFSEPLFIYQDTAKVGFYGTWTVTTISVTQGSIGQKSDKANLLTYTITTDGTMSTITEKVNGTVIGTKTATSGQSLIAGLTQAQWDAVRFGKYADATGGQNTLTVEMGSEKWTYTFDKRPATDSDILSAVKAVKDSQEVYIPAVKAKLASAVRSKGGSANDADSFEAIEQSVKNMVVTKEASGTINSNNSAGIVFTRGNGGTFSAFYINVTGLGFVPSFISVKATGSIIQHTTYDSRLSTGVATDPPISYMIGRNSTETGYSVRLDGTSAYVNSTGFKLPVGSQNTQYEWIAIE